MFDVDIALSRGDFALKAAFQGPPSGITALFGASGAGKSTLLAAIAGLVRPERGRITVEGRVLFDSALGINLKPEERRVGFVFQDLRLFPHLTVEGNLRFGLRRAQSSAIAFDDVVALLALGDLLARSPASLSGGEKQRTAIGRALLSQPQMLLMDEPLAALDPQRREEVLVYVGRLKDRLALPILYVSHAVEEVARLADHLVLIEEGRIAAQGSPIDLTGRIAGEGWGALIDGKIAGRDLGQGLSEVAFPGGRLKIPGVDLRLGQPLRLRIAARDVILALQPVEGLSVQNSLAAEIAGIHPIDGQADVILMVGQTRIVARVTQAAVRRLELTVGQKIYALIKSVAADRIG